MSKPLDIRQSFLDFFAERGHTVVPSSSLMPDSPGLLFTNAGMNQFVPIFLGERTADLSHWAGARPAMDTRAADTQKCIRAGGKHNDLEDVGFDTYHHTLFEMLGNWSFGDYFKKESIEWGWDLITRVWGIPPKRLFATVYSPDKAKGDPSEFDREAHDIWASIFTAAGLDPAVHIVNGNKKDNFWMMGETGPCGPCSEIHFNLLASDDEAAGRALVNRGSPRCIEIWNHVFIQFNANQDGTFAPLAAKHVDTGMGYERVAGIHASTRGFTDFTSPPSNYEAPVFAPLFAKVTELSGRRYHGTVPERREGLSEQEHVDIAFRVLADHARTISCAIADGILPGNEGRNYVIRRILRRGILYGTKLGLKAGFFEQLVAPVVESLGPIFPELRQQQGLICRVIRGEEESFGRTLERGLQLYHSQVLALAAGRLGLGVTHGGHVDGGDDSPERFSPNEPVLLLPGENGGAQTPVSLRQYTQGLGVRGLLEKAQVTQLPGAVAFELYDTYGFPLDMTQLLAAENGLSVDSGEFERLMDEQRGRARAAQRKEVIVAATEGDGPSELKPTVFVGYTQLSAEATLADVVRSGDEAYLVFDRTPFYAEMGGQTGDAGTALVAGRPVAITDCVKDKAGRYLHRAADPSSTASLVPGAPAVLSVDEARRRAISRHHSAEHLVHWALRKTLGTHVRQAGTSKTPDRMRFDFSHFEALTAEQVRAVEALVNARILDNARVDTYETEFDKRPEGTLAFFADKYGKVVRVVDIGGYSRELCGGTHVSTTGEIGLIKIVAEMAIAANTRRLEVVAGQAALDHIAAEEAALRGIYGRLNAGVQDVAQKLDSLLVRQRDMEHRLKAYEARDAAGLADSLASKAVAKDGLRFVSAVVAAETPEALRSLGSQVLHKLGEGVVRLGAAFGDKATVVALCSPGAVAAGHNAGSLVRELSQSLGGKGGGKPDFAMGGGREVARLAEALAAGLPRG